MRSHINVLFWAQEGQKNRVLQLNATKKSKRETRLALGLEWLAWE